MTTLAEFVALQDRVAQLESEKRALLHDQDAWHADLRDMQKRLSEALQEAHELRCLLSRWVRSVIDA